MAQETRHRERQVIRQIAAQHGVTEQLLAGLTTGRRHVCEQNLVIWIGALQRFHQRLGRAGFAHRDGVHPDHGFA